MCISARGLKTALVRYVPLSLRTATFLQKTLGKCRLRKCLLAGQGGFCSYPVNWGHKYSSSNLWRFEDLPQIARLNRLMIVQGGLHKVQLFSSVYALSDQTCLIVLYRDFLSTTYQKQFRVHSSLLKSLSAHIEICKQR